MGPLAPPFPPGHGLLVPPGYSSGPSATSPLLSVIPTDLSGISVDGWALAWSDAGYGPKNLNLSHSWQIVSAFLRNSTGNDQFTCHVCTDIGGLVDGGHWCGKKHLRAVWNELDKCNKSLGLPPGTYTNAVHSSPSLWLLKAGQPSPVGRFTAAASFLDGTCMLVEGDFIHPSQCLPRPVPLAIAYVPPRIGG